MNDSDIRARVHIIADAYLKGIKLKEDDVVVTKALIDLVSNLLININDIAGRQT